MALSAFFGFIFVCMNGAWALPDNGVVGDPELICGGENIKVNFLTKNLFMGHVFVRREYADPECRTDATNSSRIDITLDFTSCGIERERSTEPAGLFIRTNIIISFDPQYITKVDKAYMIQCFYPEAMRFCSAELQVSMLTTQYQSESVPMPICRYEVLGGGPGGRPIQFAQIGETVYHKWTCDSEYEDTFCMTVHSCKVNDGELDTIDLIDMNGCAYDKYILGDLDYVSDLMAGKEAHVFKYADRPHLFFDCQITVTVKEPGMMCPVPNCAPAIIRHKREAIESHSKSTNSSLNAKSKQHPKLIFTEEELRKYEKYFIDDVTSDDICMGLGGFSAFAFLNGFLVFSSVLLIIASVKAGSKCRD